ncbi:hypothetical protein D3C87_496250 [compost metagenome]|uniref:PID-CTERM protein-sorting domain-containing protein n=1 Tax=Pedobacter sp. ok626 TaxID=1761882 RepID=UPI00087F0D32|nr:hypothetical protein [Pedobacter sp. ok626]SDK71288.1 hypothetical protein SAMN04487898_11122 [Pedobacter sp. ok626]
MKYVLLFIFMLSFSLAMGIRTDDPGLPGGDPDVPVDGGVAALLVAGVVYGIRKIRQLH